MNLAIELQSVTAAEISAAYRAAGLRRINCGLVTALETPAIYTALRCTALAMKRKQQHGKPAPDDLQALETEKSA